MNKKNSEMLIISNKGGFLFMANLKLVKSATALVLGASVLTSAVAVSGTDASAKTTYKVTKKGTLVNAKTNKAVKGYKSYKGKLYKNGKKFTGTYKSVFYKSGVKFTGTYNKKYYVKGKLFTGKTSKNVYYKKGVKFTGVTSYGYTYKDGKRVEGEYKGKVYKNGKLVTGLYKDVLYKKGVKETGLDLYQDKLYKDGVLNVGYALLDDVLYKDADKNVGWAIKAIDDKTYFDTKLANDTYTDANGVETAYENGVEVGAKVKSVEAINAKQVKITFNKSVGTGATTPANYDVKTVTGNTFNAVTDATVTGARTVVLTLTDSYKVSTDLVVTVDGVYLKGSIKDTFPKFSTVVNVNDTTNPEITSVDSKTSTNASQVVNVQFSEPLAAKPVVKVDGTVVPAASITQIDNDTALSLSGLNLSVDKVHTIEVLNFSDTADNAVTYVSKTFSVTKDTTVATGKATIVQDNKVQVTFDKAINKASLANVDILRYDKATNSYVPVVLDTTTPYDLDSTGKVATFFIAAGEKTNFFGLNDSKEDLIVKVKSGVIDSTGNGVTPFEAPVVSNEDVTGPALADVTYKKDSKGAVTELYFHFNEGLTFGSTKLVAGDINVTDLSTNKSVLFADVFGANNTAEVATDGKTLIVKPENVASVTNKLKSGKYSFEVKTGLVKDTAFNTTDNAKASKTVDFGAVANEVSVTSATINTAPAVDNVLTVNFSKAVTAASAKDPANYSINGKALPADTVITVTDDDTVTFALPDNTVAKSDGSAVLTISNIKPQDSSATFKTYTAAINALDNTAPVAKASVLANGKIQVTFSEDVTAAAADFTALKLNGKVLDTAAANKTVVTATPGTLADDTQAVVIDVTPKQALDYNSTGFSYQYIDVDGDNALDLSKDIVLQKVQATTAPATWTSVADLNLLDSVEIVLPATTATVDGSGYNTTGNLLTSGTVKAK